MFQKSKLCASLMLAFSGGVALTSLPALAQQAGETTERIEVTGSRIKRADAEGSLPVTVVTRETDATGRRLHSNYKGLSPTVKLIAASCRDRRLAGQSDSACGLSSGAREPD